MNPVSSPTKLDYNVQMSLIKALESIHRLMEFSPKLALQWAWAEALAVLCRTTYTVPATPHLALTSAVNYFKDNLKLWNLLKYSL